MKLTTSLQLLKTEAIITAALISMPVMNSFFESIGMNQGQIGISQALFTVALLLFNIPTGWLADKFSRKLSNAGGDALAALGFVLYAFAQNFAWVVTAEIIIGIGLAFTNGADVGLLRSYCDRLGKSYGKVSASIAFWRPLVEAGAVLLCIVLSGLGPRWLIALSAIPFALGAIISLCVQEVGEHRELAPHATVRESMWNRVRRALADMRWIIQFALHGHKDLAWAILAAAVSREITHAIIWLLTPLLLLAGVPAWLLGAAWAFNYAMVAVGAFLARWVVDRWSEGRLFAVPAVLVLAALVILSINISWWTFWLYGIFGLARGWFSSVMPPIVQHHSPRDIQSTVFSISGSISQVLYIVVVTTVNLVGNFGVQWAFATNALLFAPLVVLIVWRLYHPTKK